MTRRGAVREGQPHVTVSTGAQSSSGERRGVSVLQLVHCTDGSQSRQPHQLMALPCAAGEGKPGGFVKPWLLLVRGQARPSQWRRVFPQKTQGDSSSPRPSQGSREQSSGGGRRAQKGDYQVRGSTVRFVSVARSCNGWGRCRSSPVQQPSGNPSSLLPGSPA